MPARQDSSLASPRGGDALPTPFALGSEVAQGSQAVSVPSLRVVEEFLGQPPHAPALPSHLLQPEIEAVYACGQYISVQSFEAWSDLVRRAKHPPLDLPDRERLLSLVCGVFCNHLETQTPLLASVHATVSVDAVVAVPANPARFALRGMSLPDELGEPCKGVLGCRF